MTLLYRKSVVAAKIETTSGTVESLAGADAAFNVFNCTIQPTIPMEMRPRQGSFNHLPASPGPREGTITFTTELYGDGAGGVPGWASTFLPACGWVNSTGVFTPRSEAPGANVKTLTIAKYENGIRKLLRGAAGSFEIVLAPGNRVLFNWTFRGAWQTVTDETLLTPTYPTRKPMRSTGTYTLASNSFCFSSMTLSSGNNVIMRPCFNPADGSGFFTGMITDRLPTGTFDPEAKLVGTDNRYARWLDGTEQALTIALADAEDTITFAAPRAQITNLQEGDREGLLIDTKTFQMNGNTGDDEFSITFAAT
jgi:hypothetical protein